MKELGWFDTIFNDRKNKWTPFPVTPLNKTKESERRKSPKCIQKTLSASCNSPQCSRPSMPGHFSTERPQMPTKIIVQNRLTALQRNRNFDSFQEIWEGKRGERRMSPSIHPNFYRLFRARFLLNAPNKAHQTWGWLEQFEFIATIPSLHISCLEGESIQRNSWIGHCLMISLCPSRWFLCISIYKVRNYFPFRATSIPTDFPAPLLRLLLFYFKSWLFLGCPAKKGQKVFANSVQLNMHLLILLPLPLA